MSSDTMERFEFRMPDPGEGLTEAEIVEWFVEKDDSVEEDETLLEAETDKAIVEIPAPCSGTVLELRKDEGDRVDVGEVIAVFETENPPRTAETDPGQSTDSGADEREATTNNESAGNVGSPTVSDSQTDVTPSAAGSEQEQDRVFAAPSTRRYAREQEVPLEEVDGTGPSGRVLREDVDRYTNESTASRDGSAGPSVGSVEADDDERIVREPLQGVQRRVAENMVESKQKIPHVSSGYEANATELIRLRDNLNDIHDQDISYTAILVKAIVPSLKEHPLLNASVDMEAGEIIKHNYYNIGVATLTDQGITVPVIKDADTKSITEIAAELDELVEAARANRLQPADMQGGTFTISNAGSHGGGGDRGSFGTPIIRHPEAGIIGVGGIYEKPVAADGEVVIQKRMPFSFSYDHRLVGGVTAGSFMNTFIDCLEDPDYLLSRL